MSKLSADDRKHLADKTFGLPDKRMFPMPDANHARNAISGAERAFKAGHITAKEKAEVIRKAKEKLGE